MRRSVVLIALLLLAAAACSNGSPASTAAPSTTSTTTTVPTTAASSTTTRPVRPSTTTTTLPETVPVGGAVSLAVVAPEAGTFSFSPWAAGFVPSLGEAYLAGAGEIDPETLDYVADLVVEIPTVANGGVAVWPDGTMSVTYRIRPEAVWDDGKPVSGEDFAFTYEAITGLGLPDAEAALYAEILPESVAAGEKSFTFSLPRATIDYERLFAVVLPRHAVEGTDLLADWSATPWPSAGPFHFTGWADAATPGAAGNVAIFGRNDEYRRTDKAGRPLPYLDTATFRFVADDRQAIAGFAQGSFDAIDLGAWPDVITRLGKLEGVTVAQGDGTVWEHLAFQFGVNNRNHDSLNESVDFRRAVAHAIDREALAALPGWVNDGALGSFLDLSPVPGGDGWARYAYDPALAAALLEDACVAAGRDCTADPPVVVITTTAEGSLRSEVGGLIADMLDAIGCDARLAVEDSALFFGRTFARGDWDLGLWAWDLPAGASGVGRTLAYWDPAGPPPLGLNYQRWGTPVVSGQGEDFDQAASPLSDAATSLYGGLLEAMSRTADRARFLDLAAQAADVLAERVVIIPLASRGRALAWWSDTLAGPSLHPARPGTWNLESWYRVKG